ncbi:MAG TPA: tetratricopeptide repeat protein [Cyclobacteriaceae bacterium]
MRMIYLPVCIVFIIAGCSTKKDQVEISIDAVNGAEAISFLGEPLFAPVVSDSIIHKSDNIINSIKSKKALTEDDYLSIGLELVNTGRYRDAIGNYNDGLTLYPESFKLLRHRGHRYITTRQLDNALSDLTKAAALIEGEPAVTEYDQNGEMTGTYQHWIWYHIGLCYYLNHAYIQAVPAYEKCLAESRSNKNLAGASDWLYNTYMRLGEKEKATNLLDAISPSMKTDRDHPYFRRIMLYKGVITPEELVDVDQNPIKASVSDITKMYGLANWYAYQGDTKKAKILYQKIVQSENGWPGFAFAAAEKELASTR